MHVRLALAALLLTAATACDKKEPTTPPPGDSAGGVPTPTDDGATPSDDGAVADGGGTTEPGAPGVKWADKTFEQRKEFMGIEFYPKMKASFQGHDAAQYKKFTCETCHGADGKAKNYAMPSDSIYPLPKADPIKAAMDYDEKVTKFMMDQVVPEGAKMLEKEPGDPAKGGFGCFSCHPAE
jgi:hypothetical protein